MATPESSICEKLVDEARDLITYSPILEEDKKKPKCPEVLDKNKKGFEKLKQAVKYDSCIWMVHYNIAEFYYNGLDGATPIDETKAVYHYFIAWKKYGNYTMIKEIKTSAFTEPIMVNFAGLIHKIQTKIDKNNNENNDYIININEIIKFCVDLQNKSKLLSYKILSHAIHGRILWFLQNNSKNALIHYKKCIKLKNENKKQLTRNVKMIMEGIEKEINKIPNESNNYKKCEYCNKQNHNLLRCGRCKIVWYCDINCQKPHWKQHKKVCKKLKTNIVSNDDEKSQLQLKEINILCFGDSLTKGYLNSGMDHIPYLNTLKDLIEKQYKNLIKLKIIESGVDGELITNTMVERLENILKNNSFDIVIFLGGTNDIGWQKTPMVICDTLTQIYNMIIKTYKCQLISVTIPPCRHKTNRIDKQRHKVNEFIRKQMNVVELFQHINCMNDKNKLQFFDKDGLHFSEFGYAQFGHLVYKTLTTLLDQMISK